MRIGSFTLVRNEMQFLKAHIEAWLPYLDQMSFYNGDSTDGATELLAEYAKKSPKIIVVNRPRKNLEEDYVWCNNDALHRLTTDLAIYIHPDMFPVNIAPVKGDNAKYLPENIIAGTIGITSYAGEPGGKLYKIVEGRGNKWKNIYRLNNPNLGAHYHGFYGAANEDVYFSEITGSQHFFYNQNFERYEYPVFHTNLEVAHYSDVRPYEFRLDRMIKSLKHQNYSDEGIKLAHTHPRVSLKDGKGFKFVEVEKPSFMKEGIKA